VRPGRARPTPSRVGSEAGVRREWRRAIETCSPRLNCVGGLIEVPGRLREWAGRPGSVHLVDGRFQLRSPGLVDAAAWRAGAYRGSRLVKVGKEPEELLLIPGGQLVTELAGVAGDEWEHPRCCGGA
jgi:hypothetical protein